MKASLRALLTGILDYAGMFPPAKLNLKEAISNHGRYLEGPHSWMLNNFICPVDQLEDLVPHLPLFKETGPLTLAVLGQGGESEDDYLNQLEGDIAILETFRRAHSEAVRLEAFEAPLPAMKDPFELLERVDSCWESGRFETMVYHEVKLVHNWRETIEALGTLPNRGFKLRCGGMTKMAFPNASDVATVVKVCQDMQVPLKFTAGLHHPLPRYDDGIGVPRQGFINIFGGALLAKYHNRDDNWILGVLNELDARDFQFEDEHFSLWDLKIPTDQITEMRRQVVTSFGSCSFTEPLEDLRSLGWM